MLEFKKLKKEIITSLEALIASEGDILYDVLYTVGSQKVYHQSRGKDLKKLLEQIKNNNNNIRNKEKLYRLECLLLFLQIKLKGE